MKFDKRMRSAQEKLDEGKAALENTEYQRAVDALVIAADLFKGIKGQEQNYAACLVNTAIALRELASSYSFGEKRDSLYEQADSLYEQADSLYEQADSLYEQTLKIQRTVLPADHPDIAHTLNDLATVCYLKGEYERAIPLFEQTLEIRRKVLPADHPDIAHTVKFFSFSLESLAIGYGGKEDYERNIALNERSLEIQRTFLPVDHPNIKRTLDSLVFNLDSLAIDYSERVNYEQEKALYEHTLEIQRKFLPADHPDIKQTLDNIDGICALQEAIQEELEKEKSLREQVKETFDKKSNIDHPHIYDDNSFISITKLHEAVLQFFYDQIFYWIDKTILLRTNKNDEQGRLSKGYWFLGDEEQLYFSCWKGIDTTIKMPTIAIIIDMQQRVTLQFNGKDSTKKEAFLADLTKLLGGFSQSSDVHGKLEARWRKTYSQETWQQALEEFLTADKPQIDEYLAFNNNVVEDFTPIPQKEFLQILKFTAFLREKLKAQQGEIRELSEIGKPLKLQFLQLENIGHFEEVGFDLSKQITILIGENGSGKSTVLKAIALGLSNVAQTADIALIQDYLRILKTEADHEHSYLKKHYCKTGLIRVDFQLNKPQTQTLEFSTSELGGVAINAFVENNDDWLLSSNNRFIDLVLGFPQGKKRPSKTLGKIAAPNLNDLIALIEERDNADWKTDLKKWLYRLATEQKAEKIDAIFTLFSKIIADELEDTTALIYLKDVVFDAETNEEELIVCTPDMPEGIALSLLSQGYNNIFLWIARLLMRLYDTLEVHQQEHHELSDKNKFLKNLNTRGKRYEANNIYELHGIVLIDEIDTYLHPKWQRNILRVLADEFRNLQFVVTSHSPMVLGYLKQWKDAQVYQVSAEKITPIRNFYGRNTIDLFWELHGIEARPQEIQEKISALYSAFDANELTQSNVLLTELREILGENDPIIVELATSIELMEELS